MRTANTETSESAQNIDLKKKQKIKKLRPQSAPDAEFFFNNKNQRNS